MLQRHDGRLGEAVSDLRKNLAGNSSTLNALPRAGRARLPADGKVLDEHSLPKSAGGRKEYTDGGARHRAAQALLETGRSGDHRSAAVRRIHAVLIVHAAFATMLASAPRRDRALSKASLGLIAEALPRKAVPSAAVAA